MKISLRELTAVVTFLAISVASLRAGGFLASLTLFIAIVFTMALAIIAFVAKDRLRSYAIGFLLPLLVYSATLYVSGARELDPYDGQLPTTRALTYLHESLVKKTYIDIVTRKEVPKWVTAGGNFNHQMVGLKEEPDRPTFMTLAHTMVAMILACLGGKFATFIYSIQHPSEPANRTT